MTKSSTTTKRGKAIKKTKRVAFFFGAGAEVAYGMPSGGYFALEIFRRVDRSALAEFRAQMADIDPSDYPDWFERRYKTLRIHQFGKPERRRVFEETLQIKRFEIAKSINDFDTLVARALKRLATSEKVLVSILARESRFTLGAKSYEDDIVLETTLGDARGLFSSRFFSAAIGLSNKDNELLNLTRAIVELLVGALGQNLMEDLNSRIFSKRPSSISFLDDIGSLFRVDSANAGQTAFDRVMEGPVKSIVAGASGIEMLRSILLSVAEEIVALTLSYQRLVDEYYASLFSPSDWARFTKISIFLHSVRNYIDAQQQLAVSMTGCGSGVYDDVANAIRSKSLDVTGIGTSNYTKFLDNVIKGLPTATFALNGSIDEWLDPYRNTIVRGSAPDKAGRFLVPLMFTQSGTKPMTSIDMSRRYVEYHDCLISADTIVVMGFGFNGDDGHINGVLRSAVDDSNKHMIIFDFAQRGAAFDESASHARLSAKLRLQNPDRLRILPIDEHRISAGDHWLSRI